MTLTGIDAAKSKQGEIVFRTEPPMTKEVLQELANVWILGNEFDIDGDLLVWRGGAYPEKSLRQQADIYLTEAENAVSVKKPAGRKQPRKTQPREEKKKRHGEAKQDKEFLKKVAEQTGLPLV